MKRSAVRRCSLALACALAFVSSGAAAQASNKLSVTSLRLFSVQLGDSVSVRAIGQGGVIPYEVGTSCYAWLLTFEPVEGTIELEELLAIPAPAAIWDTEDDSVVATDRSSARTRLEVDGAAGEAEHTWCVAEDDPEGVYRFALAHDGRSLGQLWFRIAVGIALHNTDNGDGWEREGEGQTDYFFRRFSENISFPLGINIIVYLMTH